MIAPEALLFRRTRNSIDGPSPWRHRCGGKIWEHLLIIRWQIYLSEHVPSWKTSKSTANFDIPTSQPHLKRWRIVSAFLLVLFFHHFPFAAASMRTKFRFHQLVSSTSLHNNLRSGRGGPLLRRVSIENELRRNCWWFTESDGFKSQISFKLRTTWLDTESLNE